MNRSRVIRITHMFGSERGYWFDASYRTVQRLEIAVLLEIKHMRDYGLMLSRQQTYTAVRLCFIHNLTVNCGLTNKTQSYLKLENLS